MYTSSRISSGFIKLVRHNSQSKSLKGLENRTRWEIKRARDGSNKQETYVEVSGLRLLEVGICPANLSLAAASLWTLSFCQKYPKKYGTLAWPCFASSPRTCDNQKNMVSYHMYIHSRDLVVPAQRARWPKIWYTRDLVVPAHRVRWLKNMVHFLLVSNWSIRLDILRTVPEEYDIARRSG